MLGQVSVDCSFVFTCRVRDIFMIACLLRNGLMNGRNGQNYRYLPKNCVGASKAITVDKNSIGELQLL